MFPFLDAQPKIYGLKAVLPAYLAAAEDVSTEIEPVVWWKCHFTELTKWANALRYIALVQPSAAAKQGIQHSARIYSPTTVVIGGLYRTVDHVAV